ncbi:OmpP1/FadL family transporter [Sulfuricaulis limicola]|nr:outer membrane protein transport protein [Sulfuricaulis limicola]
MSSMKRNVVLALAVAAAVAAPGAFATNGYFQHGYGIKAQGMAGAGVAYSQDALAAATNPAGMVMVGNRWDMGVTLFQPNRDTEIVGNGAIGTVSYDPNDKDLFLVPEFGYNMMLDSNSSFGVSVYGNGGMNTSYKTPIGLFGTSNAGVDLSQLFIAPTMAWKLSSANSVGVAVNFAYQRFKATGLQNFTASSSSGTNLTDNGYDSATGWGARIGWVGTVSPTVTLGATYQTETNMSKFKKYEGLFAEQGNFDIPSNYAVGIAIKATPATVVALDIEKIKYSDSKAVSNPLSGLTVSGNLLGTSDSAGFGWEDITVYKLGVQHQMNSNLVVRAGWNHGDQPIPASQTFFNLLAPGVVEDHLTLGATWKLDKTSEMSAMYMHAFSNKVNGSGSIPAGYGGGEANLEMDQNSLGVAYGKTF